MENEAKHLFYVLECKDGSYYAGYTNNLEKRLRSHNDGKGSKYTRARLPVRCIYYETFETKREAMQAEYSFKQLRRDEKETYIQKGEGSNEITEKC